MDFKDKTILITGGTGSFGKQFIRLIQKSGGCKKLIVFSRDEYKQYMMQQMDEFFRYDNMRYFLGDIRDQKRLDRALDGVDIIIHAAALKQVPSAEYNPSEYVKTNIMGAMNLIDAAIDRKVEKVIALSTDKAVAPINLYGATKLCADKLFIAGNSYSGAQDTTFSVVRYGNVLGSRGSIVDKWQTMAKMGEFIFPITDLEMTRFWISMEGAAQFVYQMLQKPLKGGEIFIPKMPGVQLTDLGRAIEERANFQIIGIRPGEKLHETLLTQDDARHSVEFDNYFVIFPEIFKGRALNIEKMLDGGQLLPKGFIYASNQNSLKLGVNELRELLSLNSFTTV